MQKTFPDYASHVSVPAMYCIPNTPCKPRRRINCICTFIILSQVSEMVFLVFSSYYLILYFFFLLINFCLYIFVICSLRHGPPRLAFASCGHALPVNRSRKIKRCVCVVWDEYLPESLKAETRSKRGKEVRRRVEPSTAIPGNWKTF